MSEVIKLKDEALLACPTCGEREFTRIQTGYIQLIPCSLLLDGKLAVCNFSEEELDEEDDGARWSRTFKCTKCGHELTEEELDLGEDENDQDIFISDIDCVSPEDLTKEMVTEHGAKAPTE